MRLLIAAASTLAALSLCAASKAAFPAAQGRLLTVSEDQGFATASLLRNGKFVPVGVPIGIHGTAAMSPNGTQLVMVDTVPLFLETQVPALLTASLLGEFEVLPITGVTGRPSWSPDGTKIAYAGNASGNWDIYVADAAGGSAVDLTSSSPANETEPRWSPDGTKIAFQSDRTGNLDIYTMNPDGTGVTNLTANPAQDTLGDWSPDSHSIVFSSTRTGNGDVYVMGATGIPTTRLTNDPGADTHAAWSPDGSTIAYSNDGDGDNEVYEIAPDGSGLTRITNNATEDLVQDWQALRDTTPPRIHALKSTGRRGGRGRFRFTVKENSGTVSVKVEYSYDVRNGSVVGFGSQTFRHVRAGRIYGIPSDPGELGGTPKSFRFCLTATDSSANVGNRSCARFHVLPKATKRKR